MEKVEALGLGADLWGQFALIAAYKSFQSAVFLEM